MIHYLKLAAVAVIAYFAPAQHLLLTAIGLVVADTITGLMAARKRQEPLTSNGLRKGVVKLLTYLGVILAAFSAQQLVGADGFSLLNLATTFVAGAELLSICENLNTITGGTILSGLLERLGQHTNKGL